MADSDEDVPPIDYALMAENSLDYGDIDHAHYDDEKVPEDHTGRGDSHTYFEPNDVKRGILKSDGSRISYHTLEAKNRGVGSDTNDEQNRDAARLRDVDVICSQMECRGNVHEQSRSLVSKIDIKDVHRGARVEEVLLAVISLYANIGPMEERRHIRREDKWHDIRESYNASKKKIKRIRITLQEGDYL